MPTQRDRHHGVIGRRRRGAVRPACPAAHRARTASSSAEHADRQGDRQSASDQFGDAVVLVLERRPEIAMQQVRRHSARTARSPAGRGRRRPRGWRLISGGMVCSSSKGPPGASRITKNAAVTITNSVGIMPSRRRQRVLASFAACSGMPARRSTLHAEFLRLLSFEPASAPATSTVVFFETESVTVAPAARAAAACLLARHAGERTRDHEHLPGQRTRASRRGRA